MSTINLRYIAAKVIDAVTDGQSLSECLPPPLQKIKEPRDRALVQAICYGVCRYYTRLDVILAHFMSKPMKAKDSDVHALLMVGLYQILDMHIPEHAAVSETVNAVQSLKKPWARGLVNAVLRECLREKNNIEAIVNADSEAKYAHPRWWIKAVQEAWPTQWEDILSANNEHPPFSLRVNQQHVSVDEYLKRLQTAGMAATKMTAVQHGIILDKPTAVEELPGFHAGDITVQDGAAQLAAELMQLKPGQHVLDACAAPGGKLCHILECETDLTVVAVEKDAARMHPIKDNLQRLQLSATCKLADAADLASWWQNEPFDRILLDAPCSASGVIRRHPDIKLLRLPTDIKSLVKEQLFLLTALWQTLKVDGLLVYATCSIFPAENQDVIAKFLADTDDAEEVPIDASWGILQHHGRQVLPGMEQMDGFYYAVLKKIAKITESN